jgi:hypothetical protein
VIFEFLLKKKGIPESLKGYELFLKNYPEWKNKVVYVLVVVPSRQTVSKYASLKREIDETVGTLQFIEQNISVYNNTKNSLCPNNYFNISLLLLLLLLLFLFLFLSLVKTTNL